MAKGAGHQVSPPRDRRRKSKERGRGDMEGEGGGAGRPLLFSSPPLLFLSSLPPSVWISSLLLLPLLLPFSPFFPPLRSVIFRGRKWKVKGEQEAACIHFCAVKTFLFSYPHSLSPHPPPLSLAGPSQRAREPSPDIQTCLLSLSFSTLYLFGRFAVFISDGCVWEWGPPSPRRRS